jgi:hypothetical protein
MEISGLHGLDWDFGNCGDLGGTWKRKDVPNAERKKMLLVYCNYCTGFIKYRTEDQPGERMV